MRTYQERTDSILNKTKKEKRKRRLIRAVAVTTACAALVTACNLTLFLPYPPEESRIAPYENSEYYSVIRTVDKLTHEKATTKKYKNNFEKWWSSLKGLFSLKFDAGMDGAVGGGANMMPDIGDMDSAEQAPGAPNDAPTADNESQTPDGSDSYEEVTDNQVDGVIEGDLFKRTGKHIFHLRGGKVEDEDYETAYDETVNCSGNAYVLSVYSIDKNNSKRVGRYEITPDTAMQFYTGEAEMYLSADGKTATIVTPSFDRESATLYTAVISLDVSAPNAITETNRVYVSGDYVTSRLSDGELLLVSNFRVKNAPNYDNPEDYLPQVGSAGNMQSLPANNILLPEVDSSELARYTVVTTLEGNSLALQDSYAFFAYSENVYVSKDNLFATRTTSQDEEVNGFILREAVTEIACVSYQNEALTYQGSASVKGRVQNQYSMDEYDGTLRVFTTFESTTLEEKKNGEHSSLLWRGFYTSASLYCISLDSFETVASVERFAPDGETVRSARFDKQKAYVCTAIEFTDPVFSFDLSDLDNITYTDTGEIKGYSFALTKFWGGTLLGIGYNSQRSLKIELYEETADSVVSVATYEPTTYVSVSEEYKAHFIDSEDGYVGFYNGNAREYVLLQYDGYSLREVFREPFFSYVGKTRACMVDGWAYLLGTCGLKAVQVY